MPDVKRVRTDNEVITVVMASQEVDLALREWALRKAGFEYAPDHVKSEVVPDVAIQPWQGLPQAVPSSMPAAATRTVRITVDFLKAPKQEETVIRGGDREYRLGHPAPGA